jgi:hypothetical protein
MTAWEVGVVEEELFEVADSAPLESPYSAIEGF